MALVQAGEFQMGSPQGLGSMDEHPRHKVRLEAFYMDRYPVTSEEYEKCVKAGACPTPGTGQLCNYGVEARGKDPINCATWDEAQAYCLWAGKRLPTEAEWEKAARGGTDTKWSFGDEARRLADYAWYSANSGGLTHRVGMRNPNQFGLYDMAGNVWHWMVDWYDSHYYESSPDHDPQGPPPSRCRVLRGGSWNNQANSSRAASRFWADSESRTDNIGFRCVASASGR
ncbi:MAG: SUMF1/EgtB/PvdO family nonheme iron enzyme [Elusimicrobia bacterium]|nr:SUMF1/EgtB/PvdO family nonheme iron enzyme [Elusimicrobiota bacterium]